MKDELLSIVVPVYNVAPYLERCVQSLLSQTYRDLEILLVDDGSTDGSGALCDALAAKDDRILVVHQANAGVSAARNAGLTAARGAFIGFADPDDWCEPEMYAHLIDAMDAGQADAAFCGFWEDFEKEAEDPVSHAPVCTGIVSSEEAFYQCMIGIGFGYFTSVWNKCFRRSALTRPDGSLALFSLGHCIGEDELWLAEVLPGLRSVVLTDRMLYHWFKRSGSAIHTQITDRRWYQALETKRQAADIFAQNPAMQNLAYGKLYSDLFRCIWIAHCSGDKKTEAWFRRQLKPYRKYFWKTAEYSVQKKGRFFAIDLMCRLHFPRSWIENLGYITSKKIIQSLRK